jgi:hypothetical protein
MLRVLLAAGLAFIATAAPAADYGCQRVKFKCSGFEPNWAFGPAGGGQIKFTDPENTGPIMLPACAVPLSGNQTSITAGAPLGLSATVTHQSCVETNGTTTRPYSISISYTQGAAGGTARQVSGTGCSRKQDRAAAVQTATKLATFKEELTWQMEYRSPAPGPTGAI